jgi:hypothetical protein
LEAERKEMDKLVEISPTLGEREKEKKVGKGMLSN